MSYAFETVSKSESESESESESVSVSESESESVLQWVMEKPLLQARAGHACAYLGERVVVCGGTDGDKPLNSCETFDPREGKWRQMVSMNRPRYLVSVYIHVYIYVYMQTFDL